MVIAELVPDMRKELGGHKEEIAELPRKINAAKESSVKMSGSFIELQSMIGWHKTENAGLRQARLGTPSPTLSREPAVTEFCSVIRIN